MAAKIKRARVLHKITLDEIDYKPNEVIEADAELIAGLEKAGSVDAKQASVRYCLEREGAEVRVHPGAAVNAPADDGADGQSAAGQPAGDNPNA